MHKSEEPEFAAFIGIDWADKKHDVCLWVPGTDKRERIVLEHRSHAIAAWAKQLGQRFAGAKVAVSLELRRGALVSALLEHDLFVLFPVLPTTVARYRGAFRPSGAKDDPTDAEVILELLTRHRDKLQALRPERPALRSLRQLVETRRALVHDRTRLTNRMRSASGRELGSRTTPFEQPAFTRRRLATWRVREGCPSQDQKRKQCIRHESRCAHGSS